MHKHECTRAYTHTHSYTRTQEHLYTVADSWYHRRINPLDCLPLSKRERGDILPKRYFIAYTIHSSLPLSLTHTHMDDGAEMRRQKACYCKKIEVVGAVCQTVDRSIPPVSLGRDVGWIMVTTSCVTITQRPASENRKLPLDCTILCWHKTVCMYYLFCSLSLSLNIWTRRSGRSLL